MSSKRNHAARSRKTHRTKAYAMRSSLRGNHALELRQALMKAWRPQEPEKKEEAE